MKRHVRANARRQVPPRTVKYAMVGLGDITQEAMLPAFKNAGRNSKLVALVSDDPKKLSVLGKKYGAPLKFSYDDYDACLAHPDVDAVYIALPNTMHAEYAVRAARAGVHVLCEKPMATSDEECAQMISAARDADVKLMIAYRLHFEPANLHAVELATKKLGDLRFFSSTFSYTVRPGNIRTQSELGGGPIWDLGVYPINAARYLFRSEPREVFAFGSLDRDGKMPGVHDTVSFVMRFPEGRFANITVSFSSAPTGSFTITGANGTLTMENAYEYKGTRDAKVEIKGKKSSRTFKQTDHFGPELSYFSDCVLKNREPEPSGIEGREDVRIVRAVLESLKSGAPVQIEALAKTTHPEPAQEIRMPAVRKPTLVDVENPVQD